MSSEYKNTSTESELYDENSSDRTVDVIDREDSNQQSTSRLLDDTNGLTIEQILRLRENDASDNSETSLEGNLYFIYIHILVEKRRS